MCQAPMELNIDRIPNACRGAGGWMDRLLGTEGRRAVRALSGSRMAGLVGDRDAKRDTNPKQSDAMGN